MYLAGPPGLHLIQSRGEYRTRRAGGHPTRT